ncbi:MAG: hypothetical protein JG777_1297 [Clostridia bacterium]|jgi:uncharacterized protein YoxC|nr:hypothetical protein [Clostridia bacterium]
MSKGITYHIITIVAIFSALGLGIFIGSMLNGEQLMVSHQSKLMTELGGHLKSITQEKEALKEEISQLKNDIGLKDQLINCIFSDYVSGRLKGYNVAIVMTGDKELSEEISLLLQNAGANILSVTSIMNLYQIDSISAFNQIKPVRDDFRLNKTDNITTYAAESLMYSILSGKDVDFINETASKEYIEIQGDYSKMVDYIIWVGPNQNGREYINVVDIPMLNIVKKLNIPSLIVERSSSAYSAMDIFKQSGFSTIDNIDTIYGKISMLMVMKGVQGNFGTKESATSLLPKLSVESFKQLNLKKNN